ncbi:tumor necrosis factor receptor superfamily member 8-like isoform X1 [Arapaima gigas]
MDSYGHLSRSLNLLLLVSLVVSDRTPCPKCQQGHVSDHCKDVPCCNGSYFRIKQGSPMCEQCTKQCEDSEHLVEIQKCGGNFSRECHCKKGYYCNSKAQYTCRRCFPCPSGTFSNITSLEPMEHTCKIHTNCASRGLVIISEGSRTRDHQCGPASTTSITTVPTTVWTSSTPPTPSSAMAKLTRTLTLEINQQNSFRASSQDHSNTSQGLSNSTSQNSFTATTWMSSSPTFNYSSITNHQKSFNTEPQRPNSAAPRMSPNDEYQFSSITISQGSTVTNQQPKTSQTALSQSLWVLILACMLLLAALLAGFCRGRRMKKLQEYCGESIMSRLLPQSLEQPLTAMEPLYTETREGPTPEEAEMVYRGRQQITLDHSGGGESIKNTVGSIYIYSPGMVVLGANSSERREEPAEGQPFISTPQQESVRETVTTEPWARCPNVAPLADGMQEEDHKLSYPVPATGK